MRAARFEVTAEMLIEAFHLPARVQIIAASASMERNSVTFVVSDPTLPEASAPHDVCHIVLRRVDPVWEWDWNLSGRIPL